MTMTQGSVAQHWQRRPVSLRCLVAFMLLSLLGCVVGDAKNEGNEKMSEGNGIQPGKNEKEDEAKYIELRRQGVDEVSQTDEAHLLRNYALRGHKRTGLFRKREVSLASVLFPGVYPEQYVNGESIPVYAGLVESRRTQIPFQLDDLPMCPAHFPLRKTRQKGQNIGSMLQCRDPKPTPFELKVKHDVSCTPLCQVNMSRSKTRWMKNLVDQHYRVNLSLDQLPVLMRSKEFNYAVRGYPVGFKVPSFTIGPNNDNYYLFNHLRFIITYHEQPFLFYGVRITGFDVHPISITHEMEGYGDLGQKSELSTCRGDSTQEIVNDPSTYLALPSGEDLSVIYSYEVEWRESNIPWADRWDVYLLGSPDETIHRFAIVNSVVLVLVLFGSLALIKIKMLRSDDVAHWKLLHVDVFRPPSTCPTLLGVGVGTGAHIGWTLFLTLLCGVLGLCSPMMNGEVLTYFIVLFALSSIVAGYCSSRICKFCNDANLEEMQVSGLNLGDVRHLITSEIASVKKYCLEWRRNAILTAYGFPALVMSVFLAMYVLLGVKGAANARGLSVLVLFMLWLCVSAPLSLLGSYMGFRTRKVDVPTETNEIARQIPEPRLWYSKPLVSMLIGGILPFGVVYVELKFILCALWFQKWYYYPTEYLLATLLLVSATCAGVSILMCFLQLRKEDHRWWWPSFMNSAATGCYVFLYSIRFLMSELSLAGMLSVFIYVACMFILSFSLALFCGCVGFLSTFLFLKTIYGCFKLSRKAPTAFVAVPIDTATPEVIKEPEGEPTADATS